MDSPVSDTLPVTPVTPVAPVAPIAPVKPKKSHKLLFVLSGLLLLCAVVLVVFVVILGPLIQKNPIFSQVTPTPTPTDVNEIVTPTADLPDALVNSSPVVIGSTDGFLPLDNKVARTIAPVTIPFTALKLSGLSSISTTTAQNNVLYYGTSIGQAELYFAMNNGNETATNEVVKLEAGSVNSEVESGVGLSVLSNPVVVAAGKNTDDMQIFGAAFNTDKTKLYISLVSDKTDYSDAVSVILEYTPASKTTRIIMEKQTNTADLFSERNGAYNLNAVLGRDFLVVTEPVCFACGGGDESTFVLNLSTLKAKYVGDWVTEFALDSTGTKMSAGQLTATVPIPDCMADDCFKREISSHFTIDLP